jgi:hypothetical protein
MNFEACLSLPRDPREAAVIADNLEALSRALRDWPAEAWSKLATSAAPGEKQDTLLERLAARTAEAAVDARQRARARESAEATAAVLRVLWPEAPAPPQQPTASEEDRLVPTA